MNANEIIEIMLANEIDPIEMRETIANAFELCEMHNCDYRICLDDEIAECAHMHA